MTEKILVIKIGATGDVIRTTTLLHLFPNAAITWITASYNKLILPQHNPALQRILAIEDIAASGVLEEHFDRIISLDDDMKCASLASSISHDKLFGAYVADGKVLYTEDANEWFDMGLSSRFGKARADELKWENTHSFQDILFRMLGHQFNNHPYFLFEDIHRERKPLRIGIENRSGNRWPTKIWHRYAELGELLKNEGYDVVFFQDRDTLKEYMEDIAECSLMISGDTLGMHIALALNIPCVTVFTCTSAVEIHGYGLMEKIVSPELKKAYYKNEYVPEAVESIPMEAFVQAVHKQLPLNN